MSAYREAAKDALENAKIVTKEVRKEFEMRYEYDQTGPVKRLLEQFDAIIINESFDTSCSIRFRLSLSNEKPVTDQLELLGIEPKYLQTI